MPITDPSKVIFSTAYKYFLNYDSESGTVDVPSVAHAAAEVKSYTVVIPVTRTKDFSQIQINFSFESTRWYNYPFGQILLDTYFSLETVGSYSGSNLTITFYVVNQDPGTGHTAPAFTATVRSLLFVTPT